MTKVHPWRMRPATRKSWPTENSAELDSALDRLCELAIDISQPEERIKDAYDIAMIARQRLKLSRIKER